MVFSRAVLKFVIPVLDSILILVKLHRQNWGFRMYFYFCVLYQAIVFELSIWSCNLYACALQLLHHIFASAKCVGGTPDDGCGTKESG